MNIFLREMKAYRKSLLIWGIGIILLVAAALGKFKGFEGSGQSVNDLMASMPKSLQAIMGTGTFDLTRISGYYGVMFLYFVLMATIHAAMTGASILSKEERDKTAEFLFVKPISRNKIISFKLLAAFANIVIFNLVTMLSSIIFVDYYGNGESVTKDIVITMAGMFILQLLFMAIGTAIAAVSKRPKIAGSLSTGILLMAYILSIAIDLNEKLEALKYLTPFKYFEAKNMMYGGGFDTIFIVLSFVMVAALISITFVFYKKRDLNV